MKRFMQLHLLTSYPPANLNRDDSGRPKTATMGGKLRGRISSQSLKRVWRTSELFKEQLAGHIGIRTKLMGKEIEKKLRDKGVDEKTTRDQAEKIVNKFGKLKKDSSQLEQLAHFSPDEQQTIDSLVDEIVAGNKVDDKKFGGILQEKHKAVDIAMFGRMLADTPKFNTEAAVQVAHAISPHTIELEDDFFTAVDDLNKHEEDAGAGHLGETEFIASLFYLYVCIDLKQLLDNLQGDIDLTNKALATLIECTATLSPTGKQNSFASRARASYIRCEVGNQQPRNLSVAFLKPVTGKDLLTVAIKELEDEVYRQDQAYGACADRTAVMNVTSGKGTLVDIINCAMSAKV